MTDPRVAELGRRQALLARMRDVAREATGDEPVRRVHLTIAIDRFLVRLLATTPWGTWVLKGGYANQLRHPGEARFTEDVDLRIDAGIDAASGMVEAAIGHVLDDSFTYELPASPRRLPGPPGGGPRSGLPSTTCAATTVSAVSSAPHPYAQGTAPCSRHRATSVRRAALCSAP